MLLLLVACCMRFIAVVIAVLRCFTAVSIKRMLRRISMTASYGAREKKLSADSGQIIGVWQMVTKSS